MLRLETTPSLKDFADTFQKAFGGSDEIKKAQKLNGMNYVSDSVDFQIGESPSFEIPAHAPFEAVHVDKNYIGNDLNRSAVMDSFAKQNPDLARARFKLNNRTGKFDIVYGGVKDGAVVGDARKYLGDAAFNLINSQIFAPANMGWISRPFVQVLSYSKALEFVKIETGNNPFASALNLPLISFGGGFATLSGAGGFTNNDTYDVDARADAMSNTVLNFQATYRLTVEETAREAYGEVAPFGGQVLAAKIKYASWVMDMYRDVLIWYGNASTNTLGILNVNSVVTWQSTTYNGGSYNGKSLNYIEINNTTNPGSVAYQGLAGAVVQFLTVNLNKPTHIKIAVSPYAYNLLGSMPYSNTYNPASALQTLVDNFIAGANPEDKTPKIEIIVEPLLSATVLGTTNYWNSNTYDYMAIIAPEIPGGIPDEAQPTVIAGIPLQRYMFPTVPGTYQTQYKILSRFAGLYVPYTPVVAVYSGFGVQSATT